MEIRGYVIPTSTGWSKRTQWRRDQTQGDWQSRFPRGRKCLNCRRTENDPVNGVLSYTDHFVRRFQCQPMNRPDPFGSPGLGSARSSRTQERVPVGYQSTPRPLPPRQLQLLFAQFLNAIVISSLSFVVTALLPRGEKRLVSEIRNTYCPNPAVQRG